LFVLAGCQPSEPQQSGSALQPGAIWTDQTGEASAVEETTLPHQPTTTRRQPDIVSPTPDEVSFGGPIRLPLGGVHHNEMTLADATALVKGAVMKQCGGKACVTVRIEYTAPLADRCGFVGTEPALGSEVPRGSTVVIISGTQPCGTYSRPGSTAPSRSEMPSIPDSADPSSAASGPGQ
jgi:hypothetical protein